MARKLHQSSFHMFSSALSMETEGIWLESFIRALFICSLQPYRWKLRAYGSKASSELFSYVLFSLIDGNRGHMARKLHQSSFHMFSSALSMETEGIWLESFIRVLFICSLQPYRWQLRAYGSKASSEFFSYVLFSLIDGN